MVMRSCFNCYIAPWMINAAGITLTYPYRPEARGFDEARFLLIETVKTVKMFSQLIFVLQLGFIFC